MKKQALSILAAIIVIITGLACAMPVFANSPVPPQLEVTVDELPPDSDIWVTVGEGERIDGQRVGNTFNFYFSRGKDEEVILHVIRRDEKYDYPVTEQLLKSGIRQFLGNGCVFFTPMPASPTLTVKVDKLPPEAEIWVTVGEGERIDGQRVGNTFNFYFSRGKDEEVILHVIRRDEKYDYPVTEQLLKSGIRLFLGNGCVFFTPMPASPTLTVKVDKLPPEAEIWVTIGDGERIEAQRTGNKFMFIFDVPEGEAVYLHASRIGEHYVFDVTESMIGNSFRLTLGSSRVTLDPTFYREWMKVSLNITLTIVIEFLVLLIFGYRKGRTFLIFLITNLTTQAAYNALLYSDVLPNGFGALLIAEAAIFVVEGLVYFLTFREHGKARAWLYALAANASSMALGTVLTLIINAVVK